MSPNEHTAAKEAGNAEPVLTPDKLLSMLRAAEGTEAVTMVSSEVRSGSAKGENFSGELKSVRMVADVGAERRERKEYHWMVKLPNQTHNPMNKFTKMDEKEYLMYKDVIPAFRGLAEAKGVAFDLHFPRAPFMEWDEEVPIIAMENMKDLGWTEPANKMKGLGKDYVEAVMDALARFHAYGYAFLNSYEGKQASQHLSTTIMLQCNVLTS